METLQEQYCRSVYSGCSVAPDGRACHGDSSSESLISNRYSLASDGGPRDVAPSPPLVDASGTTRREPLAARSASACFRDESLASESFASESYASITAAAGVEEYAAAMCEINSIVRSTRHRIPVACVARAAGCNVHGSLASALGPEQPAALSSLLPGWLFAPSWGKERCLAEEELGERGNKANGKDATLLSRVTAYPRAIVQSLLAQFSSVLSWPKKGGDGRASGLSASTPCSTGEEGRGWSVHRLDAQEILAEIQERSDAASYEGLGGGPPQGTSCAECGLALDEAEAAGGGRISLCDVTNEFYCSDCFGGETIQVPHRMVREWDFVRRPVAASVAWRLRERFDSALCKPKEMAGSIVETIADFKSADYNRQKAALAVHHLRGCASSALLDSIGCAPFFRSRLHLLFSLDLYTMRDLIDIDESDGVSDCLLEAFYTILAHVKFDCSACRARGSHCSLCGDASPIFAFEMDLVRQCALCGSLYHRSCVEDKTASCIHCLASPLLAILPTLPPIGAPRGKGP